MKLKILTKPREKIENMEIVVVAANVEKQFLLDQIMILLQRNGSVLYIGKEYGNFLKNFHMNNFYNVYNKSICLNGVTFICTEGETSNDLEFLESELKRWQNYQTVIISNVKNDVLNEKYKPSVWILSNDAKEHNIE